MLKPLTHEFFMEQALKEAQKAFDQDEVPIGAVITVNDMVIARAHNYTEHLNDVTAHAEMQAFTAASNYLGGKYLDECTLYVTVEPCVMCAGASYWAQIGRIVYGAKDEKKGYSLIHDPLLHPKTKVIPGIMEKECGALMREFFRRKRR
ncbi:MAG: nucleoside deaminase [Bacteroidales bacterium]|nr:nucleoside deaminase [Bacteroidales bacterium]MCF8399611.1 nucleoside deaminase [Bacteroidales bacterium]